jgi:hypothetical protein
MNEINHRLRDLRVGEKWSNQQSTVDMVEHYVKLSPIISGWVGRAATDTFNYVNAYHSISPDQNNQTSFLEN